MLEERVVRGATVRLFTFPGGSEDAARTVVCLPGLGASGRSFASMAPLAPHLRLQLWTPPLHTPVTHTPLQWNMEALAHPERLRALVLVSPVASARRWALSLSTRVLMPRPFASLLSPAVAWVMGGRHLPPEARQEIIREMGLLSPLETLRRLKDVLAADYLGALARLSVPTLILHGARDTLVPLAAARDVARRIPGARLEVLREASHLPYMCHARAFTAFTSGFLLHHFSETDG
jgi:pimeloyl-ACP methyl ester carboxylesterase